MVADEARNDLIFDARGCICLERENGALPLGARCQVRR